MTWDGIEKRREDLDHILRDRLLTKIDTNLDNFMKRFDNHVVENHQEHEKVVKRIATLERLAWMAGGIIVVVQFIVKFL